MAYLAALGVESYVSRSQLPGAAVSRRLVAVPATGDRKSDPRPGTHNEGRLAPVVTSPRERPTPQAREEGRSVSPVGAGRVTPGVADRCRFTLVAIVAGGFLWLEELQDAPLAREQLLLVRAMARAMGTPGVSDPEPPADVGQFTWPIHYNTQFDQGEEAARAALGSFLSRKLEQHHCRGMIVLGDRCAQRIPMRELPPLARGTLPTTLAMLSDPRLKKAAWDVLAALLKSS